MAKVPITYGVLLPIQKGNIGYFDASTDVLTQVKSNFINLILTRKGERVHEPTFGCDLHKYVFEQNDEEAEDLTFSAVEEAVKTWMPYLTLLEFRFINDIPEDIDKYKVKLYFKYAFVNNPNVFDEIVVEF